MFFIVIPRIFSGDILFLGEIFPIRAFCGADWIEYGCTSLKEAPFFSMPELILYKGLENILKYIMELK